jgi:hypothetical protein
LKAKANTDMDTVGSDLKKSKRYKFIGGGGGGFVAIVGAFLPGDLLPKAVGGVGGLVSAACVFLPGVFGLNEDEISKKLGKYPPYIKRIDYWISVFDGYTYDLLENTPENKIEEIKKAIIDSQVELDDIDPILNPDKEK